MAALEAYRSRFEAANTQVLAINPASVSSHESYTEKKGFGFPILSDPAGKVTGAFGSQKSNGKGVQRTVYALGPDGMIIFAERGHASYNEILALINEYN